MCRFNQPSLIGFRQAQDAKRSQPAPGPHCSWADHLQIHSNCFWELHPVHSSLYERNFFVVSCCRRFPPLASCWVQLTGHSMRSKQAQAQAQSLVQVCGSRTPRQWLVCSMMLLVRGGPCLICLPMGSWLDWTGCAWRATFSLPRARIGDRRLQCLLVDHRVTARSFSVTARGWEEAR